MSLKLITRNVQVTGTSGPEPGDALAPQSTGAPNEQVVDLGSLGPRGGYPIVTVHFTSGTTTGNVDVPIAALPADRRRGWSELPSGADDVLAYHLMEEQGSTVVLLRVPKTENWMQELPDDRRVTEICIPGTHESAALHGYFISQCQTVNLAQQLLDGIRFVDIRIKVNENDLQTFHGIRPEYSTLREQLDMAESFLRAHPSETLIFCVKEEGDHHPEFSSRVWQAFQHTDNGALWRFDNTIPTLGEVRGKGIVFTRFGKEPSAAASEWVQGMGLQPPSWPNDRKEGFTDQGAFGGVDFRCHDWYGVPNMTYIAEKAQAVCDFLAPTLDPAQGPQALSLAFNTASTFPAATPQWISRGFGATSIGLGIEGTNSRLTLWILKQIVNSSKYPRASIMLDYYQTNGGASGIAKLLVAANFI